MGVSGTQNSGGGEDQAGRQQAIRSGVREKQQAHAGSGPCEMPTTRCLRRGKRVRGVSIAALWTGGVLASSHRFSMLGALAHSRGSATGLLCRNKKVRTVSFGDSMRGHDGPKLMWSDVTENSMWLALRVRTSVKNLFD